MKILVFGGYALLGLLILIVTVTGVGPYDLPPASRSLPRVIAESRSYGLPLTEAEVERPVPDDENAALVVVDIAENLRLMNTPMRSSVSLKRPRQESLAEIRSAVESADPLLEEVLAVLTERPGWFVDKDLELGPNLLAPEMYDIRWLANHFRARAYLRALDSDVEGALEDLAACRVLAGHQSAQFLILGLFTAARIEIATLRAVELVAAEIQEDEDALLTIREWLSDTYAPIDPRPAIRHEFFNGVTIARNTSHYGGLKRMFGSVSSHEEFVFDSEGLRREGLPRRMWERAFLARFAEIYNAGYRPIKDQPHPPHGWTKPLIDKYNELDPLKHLSAAFASVMIPGISQVDDRIAQVDAAQALAAACIDVLLYRLREGELPANLADAESSQVDPFNGKPLGYKLTADGFRIWSVDSDGNDDGGVTRTEKHGTRDWDFVLIFPPEVEDPPLTLP